MKPVLGEVADYKRAVHRPGVTRTEAMLLCLLFKGGRAPTAGIIMVGLSLGLRSIGSWKVAQTFSRNPGLAIHVAREWELTDEGRKRAVHVLGMVEKPLLSLSALAELREHARTSISDRKTKEFIDEAIRCFEAHCFRSAVVLSWCGAIWLLQKRVLQAELERFNLAVSARIQDWKPAKTHDHLARLPDAQFLLVLQDIGLIDKNVKRELENLCLGLRNACGHPNDLELKDLRVAAHLEILLRNVYEPFQL